MVVEKFKTGNQRLLCLDQNLTWVQTILENKLVCITGIPMDKSQVAQLILHLQAWVDAGNLELQTGGAGK